MPCGWGVTGMVRVWVAGKTVWSPCYTRAISERSRDKELIIKRYINSPSLLYFTFYLHQFRCLHVPLIAAPNLRSSVDIRYISRYCIHLQISLNHTVRGWYNNRPTWFCMGVDQPKSNRGRAGPIVDTPKILFRFQVVYVALCRNQKIANATWVKTKAKSCTNG